MRDAVALSVKPAEAEIGGMDCPPQGLANFDEVIVHQIAIREPVNRDW